jgi:tetratricopeptide (TPR) repeat protein
MRTGSPISNLKFRMTKFKLALAATSVALTAAMVAHAAPPSDETLGRLALAEEFSCAGIKAVTGKPSIAPAMVRQSAALLKAACNECDFEPRYPRLLIEACLQLKDEDGAIAAIERYRAIQTPEVQNDQFAQIQLIDLFTHKYQTLDDKLNYLKPLIGVAAIPEPVRSHIAWVCSGLLAQKFNADGAAAMLAQALQLNPVSPEALQSQYAAAQASGSLQKQAAALVGLLESNPAQPAVMGTLADLLASVGQPDLAVTWYRRSFSLSQDLQLGLDAGRYLNYASALYSMDQPRSAIDAANMLLSSQPSNVGAATIALIGARAAAKPAAGGAPAGGTADQVQHAQDAALAAMTAQMGSLHGLLHGASQAAATQASTTQPLDLIGDISSDAPTVRRLKDAPNSTAQISNFVTNYSGALGDLVFYYTYFDPQPTTANRLLDSLRLLRPADDIELTHLEGFAFLADGKRDEAKVKFSAVADHDPLAKMGLLLMEPPGPAVTADAVKLVTDHPAGVVGAILLDGLRDKGAKAASTTDSQAVASDAAAFPIKLLDLLDPGHTSEFYNLVAKPKRVSSAFDEPQLAEVTIKNIGDFDLSVGANAAIRPDLWVDVGVQGGTNPFFAGTAYDRIAGPLVLKAHHLDQPGTDQEMRVDTGPLRDYLASRPTLAITMLFEVFTNPIGKQIGVGPGPGGYRKQFSSYMERKASPISTSREVSDLVDPAVNGRMDQKIHTLELLTAYVTALRAKIVETQNPKTGAAAPSADSAANADAGAGSLAPPPPMAPAPPADAAQSQAVIQHSQELIGEFTQGLRNALRDPAPIVRYWAETKLAELADPDARRATAATMVQGKDWEERVLGLILANDLPHEQCKMIVETLKADPVDYVREFAAATLEVAELPPTTKPAAP